MILEEFALLASDTVRTKAYLQIMVQEKKIPGMCIVYSDNILKMQEDAKGYIEDDKEHTYFNSDIPILFTLCKWDIPYRLVEDKDINSEYMKNTLQNVRQKYLIYSGYGGYILKPHILRLNKRFIHVHAGILPQYRGSTTAYYSFLQEGIFGAAAIFLSEGIDEGEIIVQENFKVPGQPVDIDYVYEPYIRAKVLLKVIDQYLKDKILSGKKQKTEGAETYFIIHPVLKHLAIFRMEKIQER